MPLLGSNNPYNPSSQPRRSKSFSSLRKPQLRHAKSFNTSEIAHREAQAAAELAFERARERFAAENDLEYTIPSKVSSASLRSGEPHLNKKQSIRFTGSNAVKTRELPYTRRQVLEDQAFRPEYVETNVGSEPSSYRKLRRAKSMFTTGGMVPDMSPNIPYSRGGLFKRDSMRSSDSHHSALRPPDRRLRRSFSFLRGAADRLSTGGGQSFVADDAAVQMARDQYLRQLQEQRIAEQKSLGNLARRRQSSQRLRSTVRTSSNTSNVTAVRSPLPFRDELNVKSLTQKARSASQTFKRTLKKVFGRPLPDSTGLPEQHLLATKAHYDKNWNPPYGHMSSPDVELLRRVDSCESIVPEVTCYYEDDKPQSDDIRGSNVAEESSILQSRITSWSNSTAGNTVNTPQFIERKRLSVIKEDGGPHQPSSPVKRYMDPKDGYSAFRQPARLDNAGPAAAQRIYSALQREIQKSNQDVVRGVDESDSDAESRPSNKGQSHVHRERPLNSEVAYDGPPAARLQPPSNATADSLLFATNSITKTDQLSMPFDQGTSWRSSYQDNNNESCARLTPQQIAHLNEPEVPPAKKPLREAKSAFFPSESRFERRALSPYRRAMYHSSGGPADVHMHDGSASPEAWVPRNVVSARKPSTSRSDSVYSRTEGGHSPRFVGSSLSLPGTESSGEPGTALIIPSRQDPAGVAEYPHIPWRKPSDHSSGEWKSWMASEVSHFENHLEQYDEIYDAVPVREGGHKRESAQTDGDDNSIGQIAKSIHTIKQPLGTIQTDTSFRPVLQESTSRSNVVKPSSQGIRIVATELPAQQNENIPNLRVQTPLNKQVNVVGCNMVTKSASNASTGSSTKYPRTTFHVRSENNSPFSSPNDQTRSERAEKFRRLATKSSPSLHMPGIHSEMTPVTNENQVKRRTLQGRPRTLDGAEQSITDSYSPILSKDGLVGEFLKRRRSHMRISDESGGDPAFL